MKFRFAALFFFFVCMNAPARAAGTQLCVGYRNFAYIMIENSASANAPLSCSDLLPYDSAYSRLSALFPAPLDRPALNAANVLPPRLEAFGPSQLFLVGFDKRDAAQARAELTAFAHEVGHQIFDHYLTAGAEFAEFRASRADYLGFVSANYLPLMRECASSSGEVNDACFRVAQAKAPDGDDVEKRFVQAQQDLARELPNFKLEASYDELFADVTAAVDARDPDVIAVTNSILEKTAPRACRSFSRPLPADFRESEAHCELSAIRTRLWSQWIAPRLDSPAALLAELAPILVAEFRWRAGTGADTATALTHLENSLKLNTLEVKP